MSKKANGFTIVELLIVVVVIAILAAISMVAYSGIQQRARASAASSALTQAKKKLQVYQVDNNAYPLSANLAAAGVGDSSDVTLQYTSTGSSFCLTATSGTVSYKITENTVPVAGGCAGHGQGGVAAITNYSTNPSVESGSISGFSGVNGSTAALSTARAKDGTASALVTLPSASPSYTGINMSPGWSIPTHLKAATTYTMSAWVYVPTGTVNVHLSAQGGGIASSSCSATSTATKNAWVRLSCPFSTSASGGIALYVLNSTASTAGMQFSTDSVMITEGSTLYGYADGSFTDWVWNGAANSSTSTGPAL